MTMKHVCDKCKQKLPTTEMNQFSINVNGEYELWTEERYVWYRSRWKKLPRLIWLCNNCYKGANVK